MKESENILEDLLKYFCTYIIYITIILNNYVILLIIICILFTCIPIYPNIFILIHNLLMFSKKYCIDVQVYIVLVFIVINNNIDCVFL